MEHSTSAPNERVLRTTQLAPKLSVNHPSAVLTADVFQHFDKIYTALKCQRAAELFTNELNL